MTERPLTIVHTEASCGWGGQDIRVLRECEWFRSQGHTVHIVTPPEAELFSRAKAAGFSPIAMGLNKRTRLGDLFRLRALFKRLKPDVVGTHSSVDSWCGLLAAKLCGVPCRIRYRHVSTPVSANAANRWQYKSLATHIVTTGDGISNHLVNTLGIARSRVTCVSTGIAPPRETPSRDEARLALCRELGLPESARFIGQVSVLRSWKGHTVLMDAFAKIAGDFPNHRLLFVGEGPFRDRLENHLKDSPVKDRIIFAGHRDNPWPCFLALDACALASTASEGIPQALIQAMLVGTPVLGTTIGGIPEIVKNGVTGLIVPPGDSDATARAYRAILEDPAGAARRAEAAKAMALAERSPDAMGGAVMRIIRGTPRL